MIFSLSQITNSRIIAAGCLNSTLYYIFFCTRGNDYVTNAFKNATQTLIASLLIILKLRKQYFKHQFNTN